MSLSKMDIFARKTKITKVKIESLGADIYVREFVVSERNRLRKISQDTDVQTITLILGVCDEHGVGLFTEDDIEDIGNMPQVVSDELLYAVIEHNEPKSGVDAAKN